LRASEKNCKAELLIHAIQSDQEIKTGRILPRKIFITPLIGKHVHTKLGRNLEMKEAFFTDELTFFSYGDIIDYKEQTFKKFLYHKSFPIMISIHPR